jgi:hypothetical protein
MYAILHEHLQLIILLYFFEYPNYPHIISFKLILSPIF